MIPRRFHPEAALLAAFFVGCGAGALYERGRAENQIEINMADFDGDGVLDVYAIRSEETRKNEGYLAGGCETKWTHWLVITRGGSNGAVKLREWVWCSEQPVEAIGWISGGEHDGEFAVRERGKPWSWVPGSRPKGRAETTK